MRSILAEALAVVGLLAVVAVPAAAQDGAKRLAGTYEWKGEGLTITLVLGQDGTGKLDGAPITFTVAGEKLTVVDEGEAMVYTFALAGERLTLSGGDLDEPTVFVRKDAPRHGIGARKAAEPPKPAEPAPKTEGTPPAPAAKPPGAAGAWEFRNERGVLKMTLKPDGTGEFNGVPLRWTFERSILSITINQQTIPYSASVTATTLAMSGGDLAQPVTFTRVDPAAPPGAGAQPGKDGGLVGLWQGPSGTIEIRGDGTYTANGETGRYVVSGDTIVTSGPSGKDVVRFRLEGDRLTIVVDGEPETYRRRGAAPRAPAPGAAGGPMRHVAGVWVAEESSLDPQFYLRFTQYVILYPNGTVGWTKSEGGASRRQVTEHTERFRSFSESGGDPEATAGRWQTDGVNVTVEWTRFNTVSRGRVDLASGTMTLSSMGVLDEGATLTLKRQE